MDQNNVPTAGLISRPPGAVTGFSRWLGGLFRKELDQQPQNEVVIDLAQLAAANRFPVLSSDQLINVLCLKNQLRELEQLAGLPREDFATLFVPAIWCFIERSQLAPASENYHHAVPGGLIVHSLNVAINALRIRRNKTLPRGTGPEIVAEQAALWTYAIFVAALLHDAGKTVTNLQLRLFIGDEHKTWTSMGPALSETGATHYAIEFRRTSRTLHERIGLILLGIIVPPAGLDFLARSDAVLAQLAATIYDIRSPEAGDIGAIVRAADSESVAQDIGAQPRLREFSAGSEQPLSERMLLSIRRLIDMGHLTFNHPGADGWISGDNAYLVCRVLAQKIIDQMRADGDPTVPGNVERIFDTLQQGGIAVATPHGKAIWRVQVDLGDWVKPFSVLCMKTAKIFAPSLLPSNLEGTVTVIKSEAESAPTQDANVEKESVAKPPSSQVAAPMDHQEVDGRMASDKSALTNRQLATLFVQWLREGINSGQIAYNHESAVVHFVRAGMFVVSPKAFKQFGMHTGHDWSKTQNGIAKSGWTKTPRAGKNVVQYVVVRDDKVRGAVINGFLFPNPADHLTTVPEVNAALEPSDLI